jgi:cyclic 2,3-diphosphoglycerate synthetase
MLPRGHVHLHGPVLVLVDGEHYPSAVADVIHQLRGAGHDVVAAVLVGGTEKLRETPAYGVPVVTAPSPVAAVVRALETYPQVAAVIDLSDEPVMVFEQRLAVIGTVAGRGVTWIGADTIVEPPVFERITAPSLAIIGTGKRIGKTAISGYVARYARDHLAAGQHTGVVVVAMGRGGPADPVVVDAAEGAMTLDRLLDISRGGQHASSDYLEDAVLTGLTTVGCRRVGGGLLGVPVQSNIVQGAQIAAALDPALVILEGSGSCIPPVEADATMLIASTARPRDLFEDLGRYRLERAGLVLVVGNDGDGGCRMAVRVTEECPGTRAISVRLEPTPIEDISGARCAVFTTASADALPVFERRMRACGAVPVLVSGELARRETLRADIERAVADGADTFVVEIKAAGIDVVAEYADQHGVRIVFLDNPPVATHPDEDLDQELQLLIAAARANVVR